MVAVLQPNSDSAENTIQEIKLQSNGKSCQKPADIKRRLMDQCVLLLAVLSEGQINNPNDRHFERLCVCLQLAVLPPFMSAKSTVASQSPCASSRQSIPAPGLSGSMMESLSALPSDQLNQMSDPSDRRASLRSPPPPTDLFPLKS